VPCKGTLHAHMFYGVRLVHDRAQSGNYIHTFEGNMTHRSNV